MKVIHINTYTDFGGAGIAGKRISDSINLIKPGTSEVFDKDSNESNFHFFREKPFPSQLTRLYFGVDILWSWILGVKKRFRFAFSISQWGREIEKWDLIRKADIIHLHWINQGFISKKGLVKLAKLNKPIVWTLHDMWPITGGCHYSSQCNHFEYGCGNCFMLRNPGSMDLSKRGTHNKSRIYALLNPNFVSPSNWLGYLTSKSKISGSYPVQVIPNPIDLDLFKPGDKSGIRKKRNWGQEEFLIVINAFKITHERKGFRYILESLDILTYEKKVPIEKIRLIIIGEMDLDTLGSLPVNYNIMGYIKDPEKIIEINQAADVYVLPSLEDNLPNTILEALACGLPTVAFRIGGIPDMIHHLETGFLAEPESALSLAEGLIWIYHQAQKSPYLNLNSRKKAEESYSYKRIGEAYLNLYQSLLKSKPVVKVMV